MENSETEQRNLRLLEQAAACYHAMADFRKRRQRAVNFYRGRQWSDTLVVNGRTMTEEQYIQQQGRAPIKQNMIRPPLRNIIGQFRSNPSKPIVFARNRSDQRCAEMMTVALESALSMNDSLNRDARALEEFLVSGSAIYRTSFSLDGARQRAIPKFRAVAANRFFIDPDMEDVLGEDAAVVGELLDLDVDELVATYARCPADEERLRALYASQQSLNGTRGLYPAAMAKGPRPADLSVLFPVVPGKCRVVEIWRKECGWKLYCHDFLTGTFELRPVADLPAVEALNAERRRLAERNGTEPALVESCQQYVPVWRCYHLTPDGHTLFEGDSPYVHGNHPFVFTFYPMVDGECWGLVEDLIDQQKVINRNMILFDFINSASAKGVLLVPEECIPDDYSLDDIAEEWARYNGVIKIKARAGAQIPQQISSNAMHPGLGQMIEMQLRLMADIGGVHDAVQGKAPASGTPSSLYAQQSQNSSINTLDYVATFNHFLQLRDKRLLQLVAQYYTARQYISTVGTEFGEEAHFFDPETIRNVDFENAIVQGNNTPAFRALVDDTLLELLRAQLIPLDVFLENSSLPFADRILQSVRSKNNSSTTNQEVTL